VARGKEARANQILAREQADAVANPARQSIMSYALTSADGFFKTLRL
jgi:hypothetical protein